MRKTLIGLSVLAAFAATPVYAQPVAFASLPPGSLLNSQTQAMAKVIQDNSDLQVRVVTFSGDVQAYDALSSGQAEFFLDAIHVTLEATQGKGVFEGRPRPNLMIANRLLPFYSGMLVRKDSPYTSISQLKGKKVSSGFSAHAALISISEALMANAGMGWKDIDGVATVNVIRAADDFAAGRVDAFAVAVGAPKVREISAAVGGVRFLPLENSPAGLAALQKVRPNDHIASLSPSPATVGVEQPTNLMATDLIIVAGKHVKPEAVAKFLKALNENKAALAAIHPSFGAFEPEKMYRPYVGVPYHPAAEAFYKSKGMNATN